MTILIIILIIHTNYTNHSIKFQIIFAVLLVSALNSATGVEFFAPSFARPRRGVVETSHDDSRDGKPRSVEKSSPRSSYKSGKIVKEPPPIGATDVPPMYGDIFKQQSSPYIIPPFETRNVPFLPYSDNLFTISAGYKIANDNFGKPVNQATIYNQNVAAGKVSN